MRLLPYPLLPVATFWPHRTRVLVRGGFDHGQDERLPGGAEGTTGGEALQGAADVGAADASRATAWPATGRHLGSELAVPVWVGAGGHADHVTVEARATGWDQLDGELLGFQFAE